MMVADTTLEIGPNVVAALVILMPLVTILVNAFVLYKARGTVATVDKVAADVSQINEAVNHKETGMPTLVQRVTDQDTRGVQLAADLAGQSDYTNGALAAIAGRLAVDLPTPPATSPLTPPAGTPAVALVDVRNHNL